MTENIENMCRTLGEMLPQELNPRKDAFVLCACSDQGEKTILISYGTLDNLATTWVMGVHKMAEQISDAKVGDALVRGIAETLVATREKYHGKG